jgi:ATP-dependent DNA helicase PIF1
MDNEKPICNGSQGIITRFDGDKPVVLFANGRVATMGPHSWTSEKFPEVGIKQVPLILAWAITIHKSQGATLDYAEIDVGSNIFECGQTYVALSRVRSFEGLRLTSFDHTKIKIDSRVIEFYKDK